MGQVIPVIETRKVSLAAAESPAGPEPPVPLCALQETSTRIPSPSRQISALDIRELLSEERSISEEQPILEEQPTVEEHPSRPRQSGRSLVIVKNAGGFQALSAASGAPGGGFFLRRRGPEP
jgi:hypothetical protein